jgi:CTP:phosphocholine cytidylyltransferase-like protein
MQRETLPALNTCQAMIETINAEIAELEERRRYWEQLGHRAVEAMMIPEPRDGKDR